MKTPDEINMNAENAFVLREAAKAHDMGYYDHIANGGKGDPAEERWIEALNAVADALEHIQQLKRERDAAVNDLRCNERCTACKHESNILTMDEPCKSCCKLPPSSADAWEWRGVKEDE